jgi:hypothetical protein
MQRSTFILAGIALVLLMIIGGGVAALMQRGTAVPALPEMGEMEVSTAKPPVFNETSESIIQTTLVEPEFETVMAGALTPVLDMTPQAGILTLTATEWAQHATVQVNPTVRALNALVYACNKGSEKACQSLGQDR